MDAVQFRDIQGFPGYRVGDDGTVWSCRKGPWKLMHSHCWGERGYPAVGLRRDKVKSYHLIHRLVLEAFVGPCPPGMQACHNDGNPRNNRLENLRWDTCAANQEDRKKHGTDTRGSRHPMAKLKESDIGEIFRQWRAGSSRPEIAKRFGVTRGAIRRILLRITWKHLELEP